MWTYQTTSSFSADVSRASYSASLSTETYQHWTASDAAHTEGATYSTSGMTLQGQYGESFDGLVNYIGTTSGTFSNSLASDSYSSIYQSVWSLRITHGFTSSSTALYSAITINGVLVTALNQNSSATTSRTLASYRSTTVTATSATTEDTTTTQTGTRSRYTANSASSVVTTSEATTSTVSTTHATTITSTTYATVPSTTISVPIVTVGISEIQASEEGYTPSISGFVSEWPSNIFATWTKRSGIVTASTSEWATGASTYSTSGSISASGTPATLTTTYTRTTADTYNPNSSWIPATATSTRSFTLISTSTFGITLNAWTTASSTFSGVSSAVPPASSTVTVTGTISVPCTYNASPTLTASAPIHVTWTKTSMILAIRRPAVAVSSTTYSEDYTAPDTGTSTSSATFTTTSATTEATTITDTGSNPYTTTTTYSQSFNGFFSSTLYTDACAIPASTETYSGAYVVGANSFSTYQTFSHDAPNPHTISEDTYLNGTASFTTSTNSTSATSSSYTTTQTAITGTSGSSADSYTFGIALTTSLYSSSNYNASFTYPVLDGRGISTYSATMAAIQMRPNQGFIRPDALSSSSPLVGNLQLTPSATLFWPHWATQCDSAGPATPMLYTDVSGYQSGVSYFSAQWVPSVNSLKWSSYLTTTTATGTGTATSTATTISGSSSGSGAFSQSTSRTWYSGDTTQVQSRGSRVGGVANRNEFQAAVTFIPGIRHFTHHFSDILTTSNTTVLAFPDYGATYSEGYAIPTRTETAVRLGQLETGFTFDDVYTGWSCGKAIEAGQLFGLLMPATTSLSKYPNL